MQDKKPMNWEEAKLDDVYHIISGGTPSTEESSYWQGDIPWISSADISELGLVAPRRYITQEAISNSATKCAPAGSLLVVTRVGLGKVALAESDTCFSQDIQALVGDDALIFPKYTHYFLSQAVQIFKYKNQGTTISGVTKKQLADLPFLIPPKAEQHRIVAKIEELFSNLDAGVAALERAKAKLTKYRASLLKAAVEGRLTEKWRAENPPSETGEQLLQRILKERRRQWEEAQLSVFAAKGQTPPKNWQAKYKEPVAPDTKDLPKLPEEWCWASLEQINIAGRPIAYGVLQPGGDRADGIPLIRICDIQNGYINEANIRRIDPAISANFPRTLLEGGELLLSIVGTIGRTAIVPKSLNGANTARAIAVLPLINLAKTSFVKLYLSSEHITAALTTLSHEVARKTLNLEDVRPFAIPLPPLAEQSALLHVIDPFLVEERRVFERLNLTYARSSRLRQAILKQAFKGELVPQDPNDEPASVLLERIRQERMSSTTPKPSKAGQARRGRKKKIQESVHADT